jgi:hypothetical protein
MEAFEFNENCPNVCFLGIKPLSTTPIEALHILQNSPDIDQTTISILYDNGNELAEDIDDSMLILMEKGGTLEARWEPTNNKNYGSYVHIGATNETIDQLNASPVSKTIQDFINVIGEPDKIQVSGMQPPDAHYWIYYSIYYDEWKLLISIQNSSIDGPNAEDIVDYVQLNQEINETDFKQWQGYGKMRLYMTSELLNDYQFYTQDYSNGNP